MASGKASKRTQPPWQPPQGTVDVGLKVFNSLTRQKEPFIPQQGRRVLWYSCGPTVYDSSHMGHARSYISFDIMRRVLRDYFNFDVVYCMNITDIDDKIIIRARQNYLVEQYIAKEPTLSDLLKDATEALHAFGEKLARETDKDKKDMMERILTKVKAAVQGVENALKDAANHEAQLAARKVLLEDAKEMLAQWLDKRLGSTITDENNHIFASLPRKFEAEFHADMDALNVQPPDVLTRVSEYVPEVVDFTQKVIDNGFAYEAGGSVYFDTNKFSQSENHYYAKLVPEAYGDSKALEEGEGDLSVSKDRQDEKKNATDFALWKASKPGEPAWPSPWGKGRPGWHIECSVMASAILGESLDIHTGGVDLKFPHHDNELAQAEACFNNDHWVRYFLHSGHLTIAGCKMAKSLKNFITIRDALRKHTARQLRFAFLLHSWKDTLDYSDNTMKAALTFEKLLNEFFLTVKDILRRVPLVDPASMSKFQDAEVQLNERLCETKKAVHEALCDSIDTRTALEALRDLVTAANKYIESVRTLETGPNAHLLKNIAQYITKIVSIFGAGGSDDAIGFPQASSQTASNTEDVVMPYLKAFAKFREDVRQAAKEKGGVKLVAQHILQLCDAVRNTVLPPLGVRLEDREGSEAVLKLVDAEILMKEREANLILERLEQEKKDKLKAERAAKKAAKEAQSQIPPSQLFVSQTDLYSQFDDKGIPTHDASGKELTKTTRKSLVKQYEKQEKLYADRNKEGNTSVEGDISVKGDISVEGDEQVENCTAAH